MGIRNKKRETLRRLDSKTLDAKFLTEIRNGLNCSPFEAEAVLEVVKEVYFPFLDEQSVKAPPGKVTLIAVSTDEPAGKPVADCEKQSVYWPKEPLQLTIECLNQPHSYFSALAV